VLCTNVRLQNENQIRYQIEMMTAQMIKGQVEIEISVAVSACPQSKALVLAATAAYEACCC